ncbi:MAG: formylglycine-generating enzyme family protein [Marinicella sp.]|nr:formylglycine-generating enzyme family protein [Xanthomonadales bacterium]
MSLIGLKETIMLVLGMILIYTLFYLRTHDDIFSTSITTQNQLSPFGNDIDANTAITGTEQPTQTKELPTAVIEEVQIPDWLANKDAYDFSNLTAENLFELATISHQQDHDFFPENQNTLVYLLKAKELGFQSDEFEQLLTTVHASLYTQSDQAVRDYDAKTLTALTARLKSMDENDPRIQNYTNQISVIYTLERLRGEIVQHIQAGRLYDTDQKDAVHTLLVAFELDPNYQPILELKEQILSLINQTAIRAAQELDFTIADEQITILNEIEPTHPITLTTINEIENQKQDRFAYLDQQFYAAINDLNISRAENMINELKELEIAAGQIQGYEDLFQKTQIYGPYDIHDQFNDLLNNGQNGPTMVVMPAGSYYMGNQTGPKHQRPRHLVEFDYGFAVSQTEITVGQFKQFTQASNYTTTAEKNNRAKVYDEGSGRFKEKFNINWRHDYLGKPADDNLPVIHISWDDAAAYANWLQSSTGQNYRLLSESEFEYILKGNSETIYPWGNQQPNQILGNFSGAKDKFKRSRIRWREGFENYEDGHWGPAPAGSFIKNLLGLYDLSGNVMEWVEDCWHDSYTRAPSDGSTWVNPGCSERVIRGGNWGSAIEEYEVSHRVKAKNDLTDPRLGFRVAKTLTF